MSCRELGTRWLLLLGSLLGSGLAVQADDRTIPRTWDEEALATMELPHPSLGSPPTAISSEYYYRIPAREIYRQYPVYAPDREPAGYLDWLAQQEPEIVFDASTLHSDEDWIRAGKLAFEAPIVYNAVLTLEVIRSPAFYEDVKPALTKEGVLPFFSYVVRKKGVIDVGEASCAMCHIRVMPDGTIVEGAQGTFQDGGVQAHRLRRVGLDERGRSLWRMLYGAPWIDPDPAAFAATFSAEELAAHFDRIPAGVLARFGTSLDSPVQIPDLIGVKDRKFLDRTGLVQHRSIGDMMRYGALNQGVARLTSFNGWVPATERTADRQLPDPASLTRYSDEQLYALSMFIYSLEPPANPNPFDDRAARGKMVFEREKCATCHTPPLYTNNRLTVAEGFAPPDDHYKHYSILDVEVGTDPTLTMKTRRGTGYYKVPSLKGVWYRGPFEHSGSVATLEDWFNPHRLDDDYVPTGFRGQNVEHRAVKGHVFGLSLSAEDKAALIAFLRTL